MGLPMSTLDHRFVGDTYPHTPVPRRGGIHLRAMCLFFSHITRMKNVHPKSQRFPHYLA